MAIPAGVRALSLCSGIGGIELGLKLAGVDLSTVCYVERDPFAVSVLRARIADGYLGDAPIWDDLETFPGMGADIVMGGFPCQPASRAGRRRGHADSKWLWGAFFRAVERANPYAVFVENVPGLAKHGLEGVLEDLAASGFDAEWDLFSTSSEGGPTIRERLFLLAVRPVVDTSGGRHRLAKEALCAGRGGVEFSGRWPNESGVGRVAPRLPRGLVDARRALGNSVVPRVAASAFRTLLGRALTP